MRQAPAGSVVTFTMGNTAKIAAEDTRKRILELAAERLNTEIDNLTLEGGKVTTVVGDPPKIDWIR